MKPTKAPAFKKGDRVTWTSQAFGVKKKKTGTIVGIVPQGCNVAFRYGPHNFNMAQWMRSNGGRNHKSYVVEVKGELYWPLVKYLKATK